jgi:lysophospholipase L1-like esterase
MSTQAVPATSKALIPESRDKNKGWLTRHERFNELAAKGGFDVLFVGDSITQAWEGHGKNIWAKEIAPLSAANFGISGDRTEHVLWRLERGNLDGKLDPKVIVLMLGTNNTGKRRDKPEEISAGVGVILTKLNDRFPKAKVLLFAIFSRGGKVSDGAKA